MAVKTQSTPTPRTAALVEALIARATTKDYYTLCRELEQALNTCASMLGIVDVDLNNTEIPVEQIGAWMQGRIAELQEAHANYATLERELAEALHDNKCHVGRDNHLYQAMKDSPCT